ncbi:SDR family NAD(P)-dependent oxidoreductase [Streptomyces sp. NRRL B-1140]|uniref:SDR family NAD(P)-dependent oxidoreductase n=1 Tax=Streptomyces sp. NRRL B-1140 TaxID=1415549 RepID=UPI003B639AC7
MTTTEGTTMQTAPRVALVTGASAGIGRAAALALVGAGFAVVGTSRNAVWSAARPSQGCTRGPCGRTSGTGNRSGT